MSNWRDERKAELSERPVLNETKFSPKENPTTKAIEFRTWDGEKEQFVSEPIKGLYLGNCMTVSGFEKKTKIMWNSAYIFNYENVLLFCNNGERKRGTYADMVEFVATDTKTTPKKRVVIFVATEQGIVAVDTNPRIAFAQLKALENSFADKYIIMTPVEVTDATQVKELSNKVAGDINELKDKPRTALMSVGEPIEDDWYFAHGEQARKAFKVFSEFYSKAVSINDSSDGLPTGLSASDTQDIQGKVDDFNSKAPEPNTSDTDDLPF